MTVIGDLQPARATFRLYLWLTVPPSMLNCTDVKRDNVDLTLTGFGDDRGVFWDR